MNTNRLNETRLFVCFLIRGRYIFWIYSYYFWLVIIQSSVPVSGRVQQPASTRVSLVLDEFVLSEAGAQAQDMCFKLISTCTPENQTAILIVFI